MLCLGSKRELRLNFFTFLVDFSSPNKLSLPVRLRQCGESRAALFAEGDMLRIWNRIL